MAENSNAPMRFCTECGAKLEDGSAFCTECGTPVASAKARPAAPVAHVAPTAPVVPVAPASTVQSVQSASAKRPAERTPLIVALIIAAVVVIVLVVALLFVLLTGQKQDTEQEGVVAVNQETRAEEQPQEENQEAQPTNTESTANMANTAANRTEDERPRMEGSARQPSTAWDYYILPESDARYYTASELRRMNLYDLYLARNEIFARHGRLFNNHDLQTYFDAQPWYRGVIVPDRFDESVLNDYERTNANLILEIEQSQDSPYLNP